MQRVRHPTKHRDLHRLHWNPCYWSALSRNLTKDCDDATTIHVVDIHGAIDTRTGGRTILILLDLPPMRPSPHLSSGRDGTDETSSHRWTPPSVASNHPAHVRSIGTPLQFFGNVALCSTLRRTCAFENVRGICTTSSSVHVPCSFPERREPFRMVGREQQGTKPRGTRGHDATMQLHAGTECDRRCARTSSMRDGHPFVRTRHGIGNGWMATWVASPRFQVSIVVEFFVVRSTFPCMALVHRRVLAGTTRRHGRCPAVDPSCLVSRMTYDVDLDRVVWCSTVVGWQLWS